MSLKICVKLIIILLTNNNFSTFVPIKLKGIHNKDYSVVKTFGSPLVHNQEAFL